MKMLLFYTVLVSCLFVGVYSNEQKVDIDEACNCDHCFKTNAQKNDTNSNFVIPLNKEDADGDGRLEICARARDLPDQSFPSVCHMLCYNRCTRFNVTLVVETNVKRYITTAYRTNYYKLRDGPCKKL